jgi:dienelactone hydrolase
MFRNLPSFSFRTSLVLAVTFLSLVQIGAAQLEVASPPIADPRDTRFKDVSEDWTTPFLNTSHLRPIQPMRAYVDEKDGYTVELLQMQWRWGDPIDLYVLMPIGIKKPPVILYLYNYLSDTDTFKDQRWQKAVTKDGFAAVGFVSVLSGHRYHDRPMTEWFISELQESLAASAHDVQLVLDYLSARGDLNTDCVGMFGQGSGASIAILAAAADPRIKVLDTIDPWGDWQTWVAGSPIIPPDERANYEKPEFLKKVATLDPVDWIPKVQAKKFRMQDASFDAATPPKAKEKLRAAVSGGTIVIYRTTEDFNAVIRTNKEMDWIHNELRVLAGAQTATAAVQTR